MVKKTKAVPPPAIAPAPAAKIKKVKKKPNVNIVNDKTASTKVPKVILTKHPSLTLTQVKPKPKPKKTKKAVPPVEATAVQNAITNGIDVQAQPKPTDRKNNDRLYQELNDRLCETEKKLAVILAFIRNQYGEDHSIIQVVKASIGQALDEDLICNVGKVSGQKSIKPLFYPPDNSIEYPRHVWVPRDSIPNSEYEHAFLPIPKVAKSKTTDKDARPKSKVIGTMNELNPMKPPPTPAPATAVRARRPLDILEAELEGDPARSSSAAALIYSDSELSDDELLHEPPVFETLGSIVEAAEKDDSYYIDEDEGPAFQILSTTSLAEGPVSVSDFHYNCNECNKRFISVRQLARHSLVHNKVPAGTDTGKSGAPLNSHQSATNNSKKKASSQPTPPTKAPKRRSRPMPASLSGRAPMKANALKPNISSTKKSTIVSMIAKKRTAASSDPVMCELCNKLCTNRNSYNYHKIIQHNAKKTIFICSTCQKCCPSVAALNEHRSVVHGSGGETGDVKSVGVGGGRPNNRNKSKFTCRHCGKTFDRVGHLDRHLKTHWPTKPSKFKCGDCGHTFKNDDALASHARIVHGKVVAKGAPGDDGVGIGTASLEEGSGSSQVDLNQD